MSGCAAQYSRTCGKRARLPVERGLERSATLATTPLPFLVDRLERQPADIIQRDGHALRRVADREADGRELRLPLEDEIGDLHVGIARHAAAVAAIRLAVAVRVVPDRNDVSAGLLDRHARSEEHTSELQSLMRISYAVFCLKKQ